MALWDKIKELVHAASNSAPGHEFIQSLCTEIDDIKARLDALEPVVKVAVEGLAKTGADLGTTAVMAAVETKVPFASVATPAVEKAAEFVAEKAADAVVAAAGTIVDKGAALAEADLKKL